MRGGGALEFEIFLGPVKWHRADRRVPFGAQKTHTTVEIKIFLTFFACLWVDPDPVGPKTYGDPEH